mgnify:CR=1 FL=1
MRHLVEETHPGLTADIDELVRRRPGATENWLAAHHGHHLDPFDFGDWLRQNRGRFEVVRRGLPYRYFASGFPRHLLLESTGIIHSDSVRVLLFLRDNPTWRTTGEVSHAPGLAVKESQLRVILRSLVLARVIEHRHVASDRASTKKHLEYRLTAAGAQYLSIEAVAQTLPEPGSDAYAHGDIRLPGPPACSCQR